jgi:hypothetical protein
MIFVLHGLDTDASHSRLSQILVKYKGLEKIYLQNPEDFYLSVFSQEIIESEKIIILENFLKDKKFKFTQFAEIGKNKVLIFWEKSQLTQPQLKRLVNVATVEEFKPQTLLFSFLDSIGPRPKNAISFLKKLEKEKIIGLSWHLSNRLLLLILCKMKFDNIKAGTIIGRSVAPWQWQRIKVQAINLDLKVLLTLFSGVLKIETMIKTGGTAFKENTLITLMFLKYLKD